MQGANGMLIWLIIIFAFMYFMIIRPQNKQRKLRMEMLHNLKVGDKVVTIGGIYGKIVSLNDTTLKLEIAQNVRLKMQREAVGFVEVEGEGVAKEATETKEEKA